MYERNPRLLISKFHEFLLSALLMSSALSLATVVDSILVGRLLGSLALSAIGLTAPIIYGLNLLHLLFCIGGLTMASIVKGRREQEAANQYFTLSLLVGVICLSLYALLMIGLAGPLSAALAQGNASLQAEILAYLRTVVLAGPPLSLSFTLAQFHRIDGNPRTAALVALVANAVNLVLDYVLIRYANMGIAGAGLSTALGYLVGLALVLPYVFSPRRSFRLTRLGKTFWTRLQQLIRVGLPKGLNQGTSVLRSMVLNSLIMASFGAAGMAAMTVCINASALAGIFVSASTDALLPIIGTLYGEKDSLGIRGVAKKATTLVLVASGLLVAFFLFFPHMLAGFFGISTAGDLAVTIPALRLFALSLPFFAGNHLLQSIFTTTGREKLASWMAALDGLVFVILFALLLNHFRPQAIWLCFALSGLFTLVVALLYGARLRKKEAVSGILLLEKEQAGALWEISIPAQVQAAVGVSKAVVDFAEENGLSATLANRLGLAIEEMAVNTAQHGQKKNKGTSLDIRLRLTPDEVVLSLRDDGIPFDPTSPPRQEENTLTYTGIELVRRLATRCEYSHQLGFNTSVLSFVRESAG